MQNNIEGPLTPSQAGGIPITACPHPFSVAEMERTTRKGGRLKKRADPLIKSPTEGLPQDTQQEQSSAKEDDL